MQREMWEDAARKDKERYNREMFSFETAVNAQASVDDVEASHKNKLPKKPMSAFFEFARTRRTDLRHQHTDKKNAEISKMLSEEWYALPGPRRKHFTDMFESKMKQYREEMKPFRKNRKQKRKPSSPSVSILPNVPILPLPPAPAAPAPVSSNPSLNFVDNASASATTDLAAQFLLLAQRQQQQQATSNAGVMDLLSNPQLLNPALYQLPVLDPLNPIPNISFSLNPLDPLSSLLQPNLWNAAVGLPSLPPVASTVSTADPHQLLLLPMLAQQQQLLSSLGGTDHANGEQPKEGDGGFK